MFQCLKIIKLGLSRTFIVNTFSDYFVGWLNQVWEALPQSLTSSFTTLLSCDFLVFLPMMSPSFHFHPKRTPLDKMVESRKSLFSLIIRNTIQISITWVWFVETHACTIIVLPTFFTDCAKVPSICSFHTSLPCIIHK